LPKGNYPQNVTGLQSAGEDFLCQKYRKKSHAHHKNYPIDRHKAAVGECLLLAHNSQSSLLGN
jgi:hypothetical protein